MRIWLGYHVEARERIICEMIKCAILEKESSAVVQIGNIFDTREIVDFHPDVIMSHPVRTEYGTAVSTIQKLLTQAAFVPMIVEGYIDVKNKKALKIYVDKTPCPVDLIDAMIYWGKALKQAHGEYLLKYKKIKNINQMHVFGYPLYDKKYVSIFNNKSIVAKKVQRWMEQYKKCVAVTSAFFKAVMTDDEFLLEDNILFEDRKDPRKVQKALEAFHHDKEFYKQYADAYVHTVCALAEKNPDVGFVYKLHPVEIDTEKTKELPYLDALKPYPNILVVHEAVPFSAILQNACLLLNYGSTVAMEAYIYEVPSILLKLNGRMTLKDNDSRGNDSIRAMECSDFLSLQKYIDGEIQFTPNQHIEDRLLSFFNWKRDQEYRPVDEIADFLLHVHSRSSFRKSNVGVIRQLRGKTVRNIRINIYFDLLKNVFKGNQEKALKDMKAIRILTVDSMMVLNDWGYGLFRVTRKGVRIFMNRWLSRRYNYAKQ